MTILCTWTRDLPRSWSWPIISKIFPLAIHPPYTLISKIHCQGIRHSSQFHRWHISQAHWLVMNLGAEKCHVRKLFFVEKVPTSSLFSLRWEWSQTQCCCSNPSPSWRSSRYRDQHSVCPRMRIFTDTLVLFRPLSIVSSRIDDFRWKYCQSRCSWCPSSKPTLSRNQELYIHYVPMLQPRMRIFTDTLVLLRPLSIINFTSSTDEYKWETPKTGSF